MLMWK